MPGKKPLVVIFGPTASGKTALSCILCQRLSGEIVSADSMQIYKGMPIASAMPTGEERRLAAHHLIDFLEPGREFSVADYKNLAEKAISDILSRGKLPIMVGGTGLYIKAVVDNIQYEDVSISSEHRLRLQREWDSLGGGELFRRLGSLDPAAADRLHENDKKRVLRALEVIECTRRPMSEVQKEAGSRESGYNACMLSLNFTSRELLYERINARVDGMLKLGLLNEAGGFYKISGRTSGAAIGHKELLPYILSEAAGDPQEEPQSSERLLAGCVDTLKMRTRNYAKRQLSWLRADKRYHELMVDSFLDVSALADEAERIIRASGVLQKINN